MPRKLNYWPRFTERYAKLNGPARGFILRMMWERLGQMSQIDVLNLMVQAIANPPPVENAASPGEASATSSPAVPPAAVDQDEPGSAPEEGNELRAS
jgi:hypothetical protein